MNKFIKLTVAITGEKRYFNISNFVSIYTDFDGKTNITTAGGYLHRVEEDLDVVLKMIGIEGE